VRALELEVARLRGRLEAIAAELGLEGDDSGDSGEDRPRDEQPRDEQAGAPA
jgi:hypothetical protein